MTRKTVYLGVWCIFVTASLVCAAENPTKDRDTDFDQFVAKTHMQSLKLREDSLRRTIAKDTCWPGGVGGESLWTLSALYLNEKVDEANARLLKQANDFIALNRATNSAITLEQAQGKSWGMFAITEYVRILCLFHSKSHHFPGRLKPETEAALKEALWLCVSGEGRFADGGESRIADTGTENLLLLLGTENHDLNRRPTYYLITALLQNDPAYRDRKLKDGHTLAEHAAAYTAFFRAWPGKRAGTGLWIEIGASYQKYSWPALFNMCELSPDSVIRKRFELLLDLAFVEEEQISVHGRRGGGESRAHPGVNAFESYKNLLFAEEGMPAGSSHSRVIETSRYQLPPEAIYLRYRAFPAAKPFVIRNRVLGELEPPKSEAETHQRFAADSALVNYAYRTPHYLLGSTLQNPTLKYSGISKQNRVCGMLFENWANHEICSVQSVIEHGHGGRPQHPFWSVQQENVLILQRIAPDPLKGSYSTGTVGIGFTGQTLKKVETNGWIFASNGQAFVGVKFIDGAYQWDAKSEVATQAKFNPATDTSRILLHAGDVVSHGSFDKFQADVLASQLRVTSDKVDYQFGPTTNHLAVTLYDAKAPDHFILPLINGQPVDLRPAKTYQSPYLNADFGSDKVFVSVGQMGKILDFHNADGEPAFNK